MTMIYVYRCLDGCHDSIAASVVKSKVNYIRTYHKKMTGHKGIVSLEDQAFVEEWGGAVDDRDNQESNTF